MAKSVFQTYLSHLFFDCTIPTLNTPRWQNKKNVNVAVVQPTMLHALS